MARTASSQPLVPRNEIFRTGDMEPTLKLSGTMLKVRMTSNMHDFSSSATYTFPWSAAVKEGLDMGLPTCTKTRTSAEGPSRPKVAVHHSGSNQLEEQIERVLELVVQPRLTDGRMHRPCHWRMIMSLQ
jgi:hypothetical protein